MVYCFMHGKSLNVERYTVPHLNIWVAMSMQITEPLVRTQLQALLYTILCEVLSNSCVPE